MNSYPKGCPSNQSVKVRVLTQAAGVAALLICAALICFSSARAQDDIDNEADATSSAGVPTGGPKTRFKGFPSPQQEPGPSSGTTASAKATIVFDAYLTQAQITFDLTNLNPSQISAFHLHCGLPGQLGPLVINFGNFGAFTSTFKKIGPNTYRFQQTVTDSDIDEQNFPPAPGPVPACAGNNIGPAPATSIASLESLGRVGQLYFNVHTGSGTDPTFVFALIRGQMYKK